VAGDVDLATAHELVAAASAWVDSGVGGPVRLDMSAVSFLDSTGVSALLEIRRAAAAAGNQVIVVGQSSAVDRVLALAGISDLFSPGSGDA